MTEKSISFCQGKGSLSHNNRTFIAKNVDPERIKNNIIFRQQSIKEAYKFLFADAVERHNSRQSRKDRYITDYYKHLFRHDYSDNVIQSNNKEKSFYEDIMQIGTMRDTACGTIDGEIAKACLAEYMQGFQERNPNFYVFNAVLHMDEATPHLHFDYIPVGHYNARLDTRNSISKALEEMGFSKGKQAISRWREREYEVMKKICLEHGIEIKPTEKSRGSYAKEIFAELDNAKHKNEILKAEISENETVLKETAEQVIKITDIDEIETGKTLFSGKITVPKKDYENLEKLAKKQIATQKQEKKAVKENKLLKSELAEKNTQIENLKSEVEKYKSKETACLFSRDMLKKEARKISLADDLKQRVADFRLFIKVLSLDNKFLEFVHDHKAFIRKYNPEFSDNIHKDISHNL